MSTFLTRVPELRAESVTLSAAEIKLLRATPITIVAAPPTGYMLHVVDGVLILEAGTEVLTESADNLALKWDSGTGTAASETVETTGFLDQAADTLTSLMAIKDTIVTKANSEAKKLVLHNTGDGEIAGNATGDAKLHVTVWYRIVAVPA